MKLYVKYNYALFSFHPVKLQNKSSDTRNAKVQLSLRNNNFKNKCSQRLLHIMMWMVSLPEETTRC